MNKYQQSYEYVEGFIRLYPTQKLDEEHLANIKELVDQAKIPTFEEVKKEWEALGYKYIELITHIHIIKCDRCITINLMCNEYECHDRTSLGSCCSTNITFQEHQLLTKTFKALGWE